MEIERQALIQSLKEDKDIVSALIKKVLLQSSDKNTPSSEELRKKANKLFTKAKKHSEHSLKEVFKLYNQSVCKALPGSDDLLLAYNNRSVFLFKTGKYEDSIKDIDRVISKSNSNIVKIKLLCRKVECLKELGSFEWKTELELAKSYFNKMGKNDKSRSELEKLIKQADNYFVKIVSDESISSNKDEIEKLLAKKALPLVQDLIKIRYNTQFGRHIVAKTDFQPGDIIFVEKSYISTVYKESLYTYCQNCLKPSWSGVPCDECDRAIFCDENCKKEGWSKFHDIECLILNSTFVTDDNNTMDHINIVVRTLVMAIKEADGDITKLKTDIDCIENSSDVYRGLMKNGNFKSDTFKSIYSLKYNHYSSEKLNSLANKAILFLISLAKHTSLLGKNLKITNIEELINNKDAIFLGSLFMRCWMIAKLNGTIYHSPPLFCDDTCKHEDNDTVDDTNCCHATGLHLSTFKNLINHSCFPNSSIYFTEDHKSVLFALHPIKKNSQIFISYGFYFFEHEKQERIERSGYFGFTCNCIACLQNWPTVGQNPPSKENEVLANQLMKYYKDVDKAIQQNRLTSLDQNAIRKLSKAIRKSMKYLNQPSDVTVCLINLMMRVFGIIYSSEPLSCGLYRSIKH